MKWLDSWFVPGERCRYTAYQRFLLGTLSRSMNTHKSDSADSVDDTDRCDEPVRRLSKQFAMIPISVLLICYIAIPFPPRKPTGENYFNRTPPPGVGGIAVPVGWVQDWRRSVPELLTLMGGSVATKLYHLLYLPVTCLTVYFLNTSLAKLFARILKRKTPQKDTRTDYVSAGLAAFLLTFVVLLLHQ